MPLSRDTDSAGQTYDKDRDAKLSAKELNWTEEACKSLDADGDQLLNVKELAGISKADPDLQLAIDLGDKTANALKVLGGRLVSKLEKDHPGLVKIVQPGMALTVSYRQRDPLAEADTNAKAAFNAIDVDSNGYLDRKEIAEHQRFSVIYSMRWTLTGMIAFLPRRCCLMSKRTRNRLPRVAR